MALITIKEENNKLSIVSPYKLEFVSTMKQLGGKWNGSAWSVSIEKKDYVLKALQDEYSWYPNCETVTLRIDVAASGDDYENPMTIAGRTVAKRWSRDDRVKLYDAVQVSGGFQTSGGSRRSPELEALGTCIIDVFEVPRNLAERMASDHPEHYSIVGLDVEIVETVETVETVESETETETETETESETESETETETESMSDIERLAARLGVTSEKLSEALNAEKLDIVSIDTDSDDGLADIDRISEVAAEISESYEDEDISADMDALCEAVEVEAALDDLELDHGRICHLARVTRAVIAVTASVASRRKR